MKSENQEKKQAYFDCEVSVDLFKEKGAVLDLFYEMLEEEKLQLKGQVQLSNDCASFQELMGKEIEDCQKEIQELKEKRDQVKNQSNNVMSHQEMLNSL